MRVATTLVALLALIAVSSAIEFCVYSGTQCVASESSCIFFENNVCTPSQGSAFRIVQSGNTFVSSFYANEFCNPPAEFTGTSTDGECVPASASNGFGVTYKVESTTPAPTSANRPSRFKWCTYLSDCSEGPTCDSSCEFSCTTCGLNECCEIENVFPPSAISISANSDGTYDVDNYSVGGGTVRCTSDFNDGACRRVSLNDCDHSCGLLRASGTTIGASVTLALVAWMVTGLLL